MDGSVAVEWNMHAEVNGEPFTLAGTGTADLGSGVTTLILRAEPGFPIGFDPALSQFMCNFTLAGYAAASEVESGFRDAVDGEMFVRPRRQVEIDDAAGEPLVRLEALTTMSVAADRIVVTNSMTGFSHLPAPVMSVAGQETLVPEGPGIATGLARYCVTLENGATLEGMTVVPYRFDRAVVLSPAVRSIDEQSCSRTAANEVTLRASSTWRTPALVRDQIGS